MVMAAREECLRSPRPKFRGFDKRDRPGLSVNICSEDNPCPAIVTLYAKFGLHRYNLLNGTNLELIRVMSYNKSSVAGVAASDHYITLDARDPATSTSQIFQTKVDEHSHSDLIRTCYIAQPLLDESETNPKHRTGGFSMTAKLPEWPQRCPFQQFGLLEESELQRNDWIRLCLELSIAVKRRAYSDDLSNVNICKVAIDTKLEGLNATVYIHYKDPCEARVGKDNDRVAVVRRKYNEKTGCFSLLGQNHSSAGIPMPEHQASSEEKGNSRNAKFIRLLGVFKPWRLSSPRKNRNRGLAFRLNKRRSLCQSRSDDKLSI